MGELIDWQQICADETLTNLPFKIELNQWNQIVMSPASVRHVILQDAINSLLKKYLKNGKSLQEFPIQTKDNVKVPDVVWLSDECYEKVKNSTVSPVAPEICIEVMSPSNNLQQMLEKMQLYFHAGAKEFWLCDNAGNMRFYLSSGEVEHSVLVPKFSAKIEI